MMEKNQKSQKAPLIYAIVGVMTLIVAVAGSTYAYFTATATAQTPIEGETLDIRLGVSIEKVSSTGTKGAGLIPIHDGTNSASQLSAAAKANCVDKNNYTACQIYKITLTNGGTDTTTVNTSIKFDQTTANLKWAAMDSATTVSDKLGQALTTSSNIFENTTLGSSAVTQYVMVYLNNTGEDQTSSDAAKTIHGTVSVTASTGARVEAEF